MNSPVQDGLKLPWLCSNCEKLFSQFEKYFADNVFYPLHNGQNSVTYNSNLLKYAVSIAWRVLNYQIENNQTEHLNQSLLTTSTNALSTWHDFLFNKTNSLGEHEVHFYNFLVDIITPGNNLPANIHRYLHRAVGFDLKANSTVAFIYIKLPGIIIIAYIKPFPYSEELQKTKICINKGKIEPINGDFPQALWDIIIDEAVKTEMLQNSISQKQQEKINKRYQNNPPKSANSETIKAISKDVKLFGADVVFKKKEE